MSNIIRYHDDLISYIKGVILKYCPYVHNRLSILDSTKPPELDIEINIYNDESQILFLLGNSSFKTTIIERTKISYIISFEELADIIDFVLLDHEVFKGININNKQIDLIFTINWTDKNIKGINCSDITLKMSFENINLKNEYLYSFFCRYYNYLERLPIFKTMKNEYFDNMKHSYFDSLDKEMLIALLNKMSEKELKDLLHNLDNNVFLKYVMSNDEQRNVRVLSLNDNNKNI